MTERPDFEAEFAASLKEAERKANIHHRDGVAWYDAPLPPRLHRCEAWSKQLDVLGLPKVERCACGAVRLPGFGDAWIEKDSRRQHEGRADGKRPWWKRWGRR